MAEIESISATEVDAPSGENQDAAAEDRSAVVTELMEKYEVDSVSELKKAIKADRGIIKKIRGYDPDELLGIKRERDEIMSRAEARRLRELEENETPEETAARLKKELASAKKEAKQVKRQMQEQQQARVGIRNFDKTVREGIDKAGLSKAEAKFAKQFLTSKNDILTVPYDSKKGIQAYTKGQLDAIASFKKAILKEAGVTAKEEPREAKEKIVVPSNTGGADEAKPKNIFADKANRKKIALERFLHNRG
jgi:hypothetical protein